MIIMYAYPERIVYLEMPWFTAGDTTNSQLPALTRLRETGDNTVRWADGIQALNACSSSTTVRAQQ